MYEDIIIIARDEWGAVRRRRHFLADEWSGTRKVLFVEPPVSMPGKLIGRESRNVRDALMPRQVSRNIYAIKTLKILPNSAPGARKLNLLISANNIAAAAALMGMRAPVLWITAEYGVHFMSKIRHAVSVYDVTDDWTNATVPPVEMKQIVGDDAALLKKADVVIAVSENLKKMKDAAGAEANHVPNGVKLEMYRNLPEGTADELAGIQGPIVGYAGSLHDDRLDVDLIEKVAELSGGGISQVFIGPDSMGKESRARLEEAPGIKVMPPVSFDRLPHVIASFDVCSIPHLLTPFTNSLDPIKAYEYLATGKPIVSTPVDGIKHLLSYIDTADGAEKYYEAIQAALRESPKKRELRLKAAEKNSWAGRVSEIDKILVEFFSRGE